MRSALFIAAVLAVVVVITVLTGCAPSSTPREPRTVGGGLGSSYSIEYIELPSGQVLTCLHYNKGSSSGSMSCNWNEGSN